MKGKSILVIAVVVAIALLSAGTAMAVITGSKHDLSSTNTGVTYYSQGTTTTDEVCVFCHTPHNANSAAAVNAPLWNKTYTSNATFTAYGTTVRGSATATVMSNATRTCLSCHDGTQAMNGMANAPGSGNAQIDANGLGPITGAAVIDGNFSDDHPLGVLYDTTNDLRTPAAASPITGLVKMNAVSSVLATSGADTVECASCHDVHNDSGTPLFLPFANTGSQLCLTCHLK